MSKTYRDNPQEKKQITRMKEEKGEHRKMTPYKRNKHNYTQDDV